MKKIYIQPETTVVRITQTLLQSASKGGGLTLTLDINEEEKASADEQLSRAFSWDDED
ncbi:hypothetical protein [uncultured Prevotella sp.]|uniref:hypothetical protein n=1 Tax=uncultured Prevotella sp. TaxID=159272 RepID=UPI0025826BBD|nr:hypothetical protein [uncultured Prevotella sp.]